MPLKRSANGERSRSHRNRDTEPMHEPGIKGPFDRWIVVRAAGDLADPCRKPVSGTGHSQANSEAYCAA